MIRPALLLLVAMTVCGCAHEPRKMDDSPEARYVMSHPCKNVEHIDSYTKFDYSTGLPVTRLGFTAYKCEGIDVRIFVDDPKEPK